MKKLTLILLFSISINAYAQNRTKSDSLKLLLTKQKNDTNRVLTLVRLARLYMYSKPDTTLLLSSRGLSLSQQIGFAKGEALCLGSIADAYDILGNFPKSLENYFRALKIHESLSDLKGVRANLGAIGTVYAQQEEYHLALEYTFKAKAMAEKDKNERAIGLYLLNIGDGYNKLGLYDSARMYTQQSYEVFLKLDDDGLIGCALNNLGEIHAAVNQDALAMEYFRLALPYLIQEEDVDVQCYSYMGLAKLFRKKGQADSCLYYAGLALNMAKDARFTKHIYETGRFLTDFYKEKQNIDSAFAYLQLTMATKDSMFSQEKVKQVQNLSLQEKLRQQEIAEAKQKAAEERKHTLQLIGITAFIITFILFFLLFIRRRTKPRTIEFFGVVALLMVFEFIALFIHPYLEKWTHHSPVLMLLILVGIASILVPLHHRLEKVLKEKMVQQISVARPVKVQALKKGTRKKSK